MGTGGGGGLGDPDAREPACGSGAGAFLSDYDRTLQRESRTTPYPEERLQRLCP
ncbi:hypothetical protein QFZ55_002106 [Streptomyces luteogriseus]|nr:hypothetical protein [Streptomyces luteogriseus]